jgi:anti-sigma factor RsiW
MMHDCADGDMRDLLPGYVHGTVSAAERATVAAHLETCADCAAEVELIAAASRAFSAPAVDFGRIVKALPAAPRGARRGVAAGRAWRVAAAIGIVAIGAFSVIALREFFRAAPRQAASVPASVPVPAAGTALATTDAPHAPIVVDSPVHVSSPAVSSNPRSGISFGGGISDLTDDQLNTLLGELDALQALPSTEPETHLSPIVPMADGGHNAR